MGKQEELHQIIYKHVYKCLDVGVLSDEFMSGPLWRATEAAAIEAGALAQSAPKPIADAWRAVWISLNTTRTALFEDEKAAYLKAHETGGTVFPLYRSALRAPEAADAGAVAQEALTILDDLEAIYRLHGSKGLQRVREILTSPTAAGIAAPAAVAYRWRYKDVVENNPWRLEHSDTRSHVTCEVEALGLLTIKGE